MSFLSAVHFSVFTQQDRSRPSGIPQALLLFRFGSRARARDGDHHVHRLDRERYHLAHARRDVATGTAGAVPGRLLAGLEYRGGDQHQRPVRHLPLGLGLLHVQDFNGDIALIAVLRRVLDPGHGPPVERRPLRLPAPMGRGACAHGQSATRHAPLDRHRRGHLPDGVASAPRRNPRPPPPRVLARRWRAFTPGSRCSSSSTATPGSWCARPGLVARQSQSARHALTGDGRRVRGVGLRPAGCGAAAGVAAE